MKLRNGNGNGNGNGYHGGNGNGHLENGNGSNGNGNGNGNGRGNGKASANGVTNGNQMPRISERVESETTRWLLGGIAIVVLVSRMALSSVGSRRTAGREWGKQKPRSIRRGPYWSCYDCAFSAGSIQRPPGRVAFAT